MSRGTRIVPMLTLAVLAGGARKADEPERYIAAVAPVRAVDLQFRFAGVLTAVHAPPGARVQWGSLVAEIDARPLQEELAVASLGLRRLSFFIFPLPQLG